MPATEVPIEHPIANQPRTEARRVSHNAAGRKYYAVHREEVRARNQKRSEKKRAAGLCVSCSSPRDPRSRHLCTNCLERHAESKRKHRPAPKPRETKRKRHAEPAIIRFLERLTIEKGCAPLTIEAYGRDLAQLSEFL